MLKCLNAKKLKRGLDKIFGFVKIKVVNPPCAYFL